MIEKGLVEEVQYLVSRGATIDNQSMKAIGYKELLPYINGEDSLENCVEKIKQHSRNYAKRQITFMNQFPNIIKILSCNKDETVEKIYNILEDKNGTI